MQPKSCFYLRSERLVHLVRPVPAALRPVPGLRFVPQIMGTTDLRRSQHFRRCLSLFKFRPSMNFHENDALSYVSESAARGPEEAVNGACHTQRGHTTVPGCHGLNADHCSHRLSICILSKAIPASGHCLVKAQCLVRARNWGSSSTLNPSAVSSQPPMPLTVKDPERPP